MRIDMTNFQKIPVRKKSSNKDKRGWKYERKQQRRVRLHQKNAQLGNVFVI